MKILSSKSLLNGLALIAIGLFLSLGFWQVNRGLEKAQWIAQSEQGETQPPLVNQDLMPFPSELSHLKFRTVELKGKFDNKHVFFLDNQFYEGLEGYHVMVPFHCPNGLIFLVNRGFIPKSNALPTLEIMTDTVTIRGILRTPVHNRFIFTNLHQTDISWPKRVLEVDIAEFSKLLNVHLAPMVVNLQKNSDFTYIVPKSTIHTLTPERHWGYAAQWFCFALILIGITLYFNWKARRK